MAELPPLATATWPEVDTAARRVLLLPLGSTEQHGPHLPLATDTVVASRLAELVHRRLPEVGLAPAIPYGSSGEHAHFPGTLSIGTEALYQLLVEFVRHAAGDWRHVLVVNGHGGNADALARAAELTRYEGRSLQVHHAASGGPRADPHAGYRETCLMLHLAPDTVRTDLAAPGATGPLAELLPRIAAGGVRAISPNGVLGDPTGADAQEGARIFAGMADRLLDRVRGLLATP
ncbi:mycofactocin biosynthesis peptidyl-dipeptidase MftE [Nakamurella sp.]|uniref:mycofactocin biosynthesis peptidyl-dipeptidase MftE n=1 Tax=Nakamurella sp. TaxID=1869182 RepID=UPI0037847880